jgi:hypothetical protein
MPRFRYLGILRYLHFADNDEAPNSRDPDRDRMYKIRPLITMLNEKFQVAYQPDREICLDESVLLFKGRLLFKQYLPLKRARFGIKIFSLCESVTGYTYHFRIYGGKDAPDDIIHQVQMPGGKTDHLTVFMVRPLLDMGYHLYIDNWYTSLKLIHYLGTRQTAVCGTMRKNRVPAQVRDIQTPVGETSARRSGQCLIQKYRPKSTKVVFIASSIHDETTAQVYQGRGRSRKEITKPETVLDCNPNMGGVDRVDQV